MFKFASLGQYLHTKYMPELLAHCADSPSRELDAHIAASVLRSDPNYASEMTNDPDMYAKTRENPKDRETNDGCYEGEFWTCSNQGTFIVPAPKFTTDADAALALVERMLPDKSRHHRIILQRSMWPEGDYGCNWQCVIRAHAEDGQTRYGSTMGLALMSSLFTFLLKLENENEK